MLGFSSLSFHTHTCVRTHTHAHIYVYSYLFTETNFPDSSSSWRQLSPKFTHRRWIKCMGFKSQDVSTSRSPHGAIPTPSPISAHCWIRMGQKIFLETLFTFFLIICGHLGVSSPRVRSFSPYWPKVHFFPHVCLFSTFFEGKGAWVDVGSFALLVNFTLFGWLSHDVLIRNMNKISIWGHIAQFLKSN